MNSDSLAAVATVATAYGKVFGPAQMQLVQWTIDGFQIKRRFRGLLNLGIGMGLALVLSSTLAWLLGDVRWVGIGILAGIIASVEAARVHDGSARGVVL